jgi:hypothetical protein
VVLRRLAERLPPTSQRRVTIIGGVAIALAYGSRRTTKDSEVAGRDALRDAEFEDLYDLPDRGAELEGAARMHP